MLTFACETREILFVSRGNFQMRGSTVGLPLHTAKSGYLTALIEVARAKLAAANHTPPELLSLTASTGTMGAETVAGSIGIQATTSALTPPTNAASSMC